MGNTNVIPKELSKPHKAATKAIDDWVKEHYPVGLPVVHKAGKYKGRRAVLKYVFWEDRLSDGGYSVMVIVKTRTLRDPNVFINSNDSYHRTYANFGEFFEKENVDE